jgi:hypothetical protein
MAAASIKWVAWLSPVHSETMDITWTILEGLLFDQVALSGVLHEIHELNLPLL